MRKSSHNIGQINNHQARNGIRRTTDIELLLYWFIHESNVSSPEQI